jgi:hypothetical protein
MGITLVIGIGVGVAFGILTVVTTAPILEHESSTASTQAEKQIALDRERLSLVDSASVESAPLSDIIMTEDSELLSYVRTYGPALTFDVIVHASSEVGIDCHNRAHELGRASYELIGEDVFGLTLPQCHSGFYHGSIEAFFRENGTADLEGNLRLICSDKNYFFIHQCMHGIGHGMMAFANYELPMALDLCNFTPTSLNQASCRTGVFMENIVQSLGLLVDDDKDHAHKTRYLSDDPHFPCNIVNKEYKADCYFLQTDRMVQLSNSGFQGVAEECSNAPPQYHYTCFASMGRTISGNINLAHEDAIKECQWLEPGQNRNYCIKGIYENLFWVKDGQEDALIFCGLLNEQDGRSECYLGIIERATVILDEVGQEVFCAKIPEEFRIDCHSKRI